MHVLDTFPNLISSLSYCGKFFCITIQLLKISSMIAIKNGKFSIFFSNITIDVNKKIKCKIWMFFYIFIIILLFIAGFYRMMMMTLQKKYWLTEYLSNFQNIVIQISIIKTLKLLKTYIHSVEVPQIDYKWFVLIYMDYNTFIDTIQYESNAMFFFLCEHHNLHHDNRTETLLGKK